MEYQQNLEITVQKQKANSNQIFLMVDKLGELEVVVQYKKMMFNGKVCNEDLVLRQTFLVREQVKFVRPPLPIYLPFA